MRKKTDWADLTFQFLSFAVMCLILSVARLPFVGKILLAFAASVLLSFLWAQGRKMWRKRRAEPRRIRVVSVKNADD
ncbi:MAG: hypothetical protein HIU81_10415 [Acidobacteria bacterium]|nr:hypothetical protein [Acidobacteriota bacterium]